MRLVSLPALLLVAATALVQPVRATTPPPPDDLKPKEWKPQKEMKRVFEDFETVQDMEQLTAHIQKVEALLADHSDWVDLNRHYIGLTSPRMADRWSEIQPRYQAFFAKDSTNAIYPYYLGLMDRGAASEALFRRSLSLDPKSYYARCGLGLALLQQMQAQPDSAFPLLFEAVRMRPDHPYGWQALALAYEIQKDFENAIKARKMEQVVEPQSFQPVNYEARDLQQAGRMADATTEVEGFVKKHSSNKAALRALVAAYRSSDRSADAIRVQTDLAGVSKDPEESYNAATMLAAGGDAAKAREWLKKAVEWGFDDHQRAATDIGLAALRADSVFFSSITDQMKVQHEKNKPARIAKVLATLIDRPAPSFVLKTMDGADLKLDDLKGKVVILDFWATWCGPCQMSLPLVRNVYKATQGKAVQVLCMNVWEKDKERAKVAPFWKDKGFPMTVGLADASDATNYGVTGIPTLFVIDPQGHIRYRHVGYGPTMDEDVLYVVESLLAAKQ